LRFYKIVTLALVVDLVLEIRRQVGLAVEYIKLMALALLEIKQNQALYGLMK